MEAMIDQKMNELAVLTKSELKDNPPEDKGSISLADREAIIRLHRQGWSEEEIAKRMNRSVGEIQLLIEGNGFLN